MGDSGSVLPLNEMVSILFGPSFGFQMKKGHKSDVLSCWIINQRAFISILVELAMGDIDW